MKCPECNHYIPDGLLACPTCVEERSRKAFREFQIRPMRFIARGHAALTTRFIGTTRHVQMVGAARTLCWEPVESYMRRQPMDLDKFLESQDENIICEKCRAEVRALVQEATASCSG